MACSRSLAKTGKPNKHLLIASTPSRSRPEEQYPEKQNALRNEMLVWVGGGQCIDLQGWHDDARGVHVRAWHNSARHAACCGPCYHVCDVMS